MMSSFDANTTEIKKKDTLKSIKKCVSDSIKTRFDPIPGASLVFVKPSNSDIDEHNNLDIPEPYIRRLRLIAYNI